MDLSLARKCLEDLVREYDKVEVPYMGTFLTSLIPAAFSSDRNMIYPPSYKLTFVKKNVTGEEGRLFVERLANMADISPDKAKAEWKEMLGSHRDELEAFLDSEKHPEIFPENVTLKYVTLSDERGLRRKRVSVQIWLPALTVALAAIAALGYFFLIAQ